MVDAPYVPEAGDVVWLDFDPQTGHEQAGRRPALVLSPKRYNEQRGMMICCLMSSRIKGYVFEIVMTHSPPSVVLADQVKNLDWKARRAEPKSVAPPDILRAVQRKVKILLGL